LRAAPRKSGAAALDDAAIASLGWSRPETEQILRGLGYLRTRKAADDTVSAWRRRAPQKPQPAKPAPAASPFSALAALNAPAKRRPRRKRPRRAAAS
jgi:hypothetical protein